MFIGMLNRGFVASQIADYLEWRHQGTPGDDSASAPPRTGEDERVWRFWRARVTPSPHERGEGILRHVFGRPETAGTRERVPDQPGSERPGDFVEFHTTDEPGRRDQ